jgi:hypothetical protein
MIQLLKKRFPFAWFKDGAEFSTEFKDTIWCGEGAKTGKYKKREQMFNYYNRTKKYKQGAHIELHNFIKKHNYELFQYDGGTFFLIPKL